MVSLLLVPAVVVLVPELVVINSFPCQFVGDLAAQLSDAIIKL